MIIGQRYDLLGCQTHQEDDPTSGGQALNSKGRPWAAYMFLEKQRLFVAGTHHPDPHNDEPDKGEQKAKGWDEVE